MTLGDNFISGSVELFADKLKVASNDIVHSSPPPRARVWGSLVTSKT